MAPKEISVNRIVFPVPYSRILLENNDFFQNNDLNYFEINLKQKQGCFQNSSSPNNRKHAHSRFLDDIID
jgi:hypothetical protein